MLVIMKARKMIKLFKFTGYENGRMIKIAKTRIRYMYMLRD